MEVAIALGWILIGYSIGLIHEALRVSGHINTFLSAYTELRTANRELLDQQAEFIEEQAELIERLLKTYWHPARRKLKN